MKIESIDKLIKSLQKERFVYIQPHNYPDHDAIASAYGLQYLFEQFGVESKIVYHRITDLSEGSFYRKFFNHLF